MKFLRYGEKDLEKPAVLDAQNQIRDLSSVLQDINCKALTEEKLLQLSQLDFSKLPIIPPSVRIGPCVADVGNFFCIGLNYKDHIEETGSKLPEEPVVFSKATSAICGANDDLIIPKGSTKTDWEVELGVVIGKRTKNVSEQEALDYVFGYCLVNDFSERHFQKDRGGQWIKGKSCESFGPIGPWLVTKDEIPDPQNLSLWLSVDDKRYQDGHTKNMLYSVAYLISYLSQFFVLLPGDIIATGTPAGVGLGQKPVPVFLKPGQMVKLGIKGLGEQTHQVISD